MLVKTKSKSFILSSSFVVDQHAELVLGIFKDMSDEQYLGVCLNPDSVFKEFLFFHLSDESVAEFVCNRISLRDVCLGSIDNQVIYVKYKLYSGIDQEEKIYDLKEDAGYLSKYLVDRTIEEIKESC